MIDLRNHINKKKFLKINIQKKEVDIAEKIVDFNKQQNFKEFPSDLAKYIKILTPKGKEIY